MLAVSHAFFAKLDAFLSIFFAVQATQDAPSDILPTPLSEADMVFGKLVVHGFLAETAHHLELAKVSFSRRS